ncbi:hypothetical protein KJ632_00760 [Patescibacteria group bacterium]|nr:hypothetical protein [Patescibacteria group bacterium]
MDKIHEIRVRNYVIKLVPIERGMYKVSFYSLGKQTYTVCEKCGGINSHECKEVTTFRNVVLAKSIHQFLEIPGAKYMGSIEKE